MKMLASIRITAGGLPDGERIPVSSFPDLPRAGRGWPTPSRPHAGPRPAEDRTGSHRPAAPDLPGSCRGARPGARASREAREERGSWFSSSDPYAPPQVNYGLPAHQESNLVGARISTAPQKSAAPAAPTGPATRG